MITEDLIYKASYRISYQLQFFADAADKTEEPTAKKLNDARKEGQVAKSSELIMASGLATLFIVLKLFAGRIAEAMLGVYKESFQGFDKYTNGEFSLVMAKGILSNAMITIIKTCLPVFISAMAISFVVVLYQVKWKVSLKIIKPKFSHINPVNGFRRMFSKDKIVNLIIEVVKIAIISLIAYNTLKDEWTTLFRLYDMELELAIYYIGDLVIDLGMKISMIFLVIGFADLIYQKMKFKKEMRMTKQEVKDELKNSEGDPAIKSRIRSKMREVSMRRMMQNLPKADVVITNPTHLAAAIQYDKKTSSAPVLIAKGADYLAQKIKDAAKEYNITIVENKPLARMLYYNVEVGAEIPPELYQMTAEVLAYVYNLKNKAV